MDTKKKTIRHLIEAFLKAGMPVSPSWIRRQEDKGNLILPRSTTNFKMAQGARRPGAVRYMSDKQINNILKAFLPEGTRLPSGDLAIGKGYYNYKQDEISEQN